MVEISSSRRKFGGYLGISLAFVAIGLWMLQTPNGDGFMPKFALMFFGLCAIVNLWMLVRPQRLLLDDQGFTLLGGLIRSPNKVHWRDVDDFFVYRLPKGPTMVAFNYKPGVAKKFSLSDKRWSSADGGLPLGWPQSSQEMVKMLNAYRTKAQEKAETATSSA